MMPCTLLVDSETCSSEHNGMVKLLSRRMSLIFEYSCVRLVASILAAAADFTSWVYLDR